MSASNLGGGHRYLPSREHHIDPEYERDCALAQRAYAKIKRQMDAVRMSGENAPKKARVFVFARDICRLLGQGARKKLSVNQRQALMNILDIETLPPLAAGPPPAPLPLKPPSRKVHGAE